jgi:branched-chain amino acid transport system substrate-binding protein
MALNLTRPQARRIFIIGLGAAAVSLAGCQTGRRPVRPGPIVEPPPLVIEQNMVAVILPLTGSDGPVGTSISNAARLALLDTGEKSIKVTVYDSTVPGGAVAATQRAIAEGNRLILGPLLAEDVRAAAPVARRAGVPIIAFSNDEGVAGNGVYIMGFTPDQSISRVVSYARGKGSSRFAALVPTGLYGQRAAQAMIGAVRKSDGTVSVIQSYDR